MKLSRNISLKTFNTFGIDARCAVYGEFASAEELCHGLNELDVVPMILGGGSNLLITTDLHIPVLRNCIMGLEILEDGDDEVLVRIGAGENWHRFVQWAIANDLGGVENLSLIPGCVGAAPIQNIGAYGVELIDVFERLEAIHLESGEFREFDAAACAFGYRDSVFKKALKGQYAITAVVLKLTRRHMLQLSYGAVRQTLEEAGKENPTIRDVSNAVIQIRQAKLPDPAITGNAGSFFKNPEITPAELERLLFINAETIHYRLDNGMYKVPAGWLIEQCGWKGKEMGNAACYHKQALVLVNNGVESGEEILALAQAIQRSVEDTFGIQLVPEVNIL